MSDWPRFPIPAVPGWNNPDDGVVSDLVAAYDSGTDTLTISSASGLLADYAANTGGATCAILGLTGTHSSTGPWLASLNPWDATTVSDTEVTLEDAAGFLNIDAPDSLELTLVELFTAECAPTTVVATWTGSLTINGDLASLIDFALGQYVNANSSTGLIPTSNDYATADAHPGVLLSTPSALDANIGGVRFDTSGGDVDVLVAATPAQFTSAFGTDSGGFWAVWDDTLAGQIVQNVQLLDTGGAPMGAPYAVNILMATVSEAGKLVAGSDTIRIDFAPDLSIAPTNVVLAGHTGGVAAGKNYISSDPQVVEWSEDRIVIQDAVRFVAGFNFEGIQITGNGVSFARYGNPIAPIA